MGVQTYAIHSLYDLAQPTLRQHGQAPVCFVYVVFRSFSCFEMVGRIDPKARSAVEALLPLFRSNIKLLENLPKSVDKVSLRSVERIRWEKKKEAQGWQKPPPKLTENQKPHPSRKFHIKKIAGWIDPKISLTVSEMARRLKMSPRYVGRIVNNVLGVHQVKKRKVQELTEKQKAVRYDRGKKFLKKYLTRRKLKLLFTMDETMIRTSDLQGQSTFYYKGSRVVVPEDLQKLPRKNWPKQILVAMGICWYGKSRLYVVPEKTKVNSDVFIKKILKPMVTYDIPRLFGNKKHKVIFHMDSAPSHRAAKTQDFLRDQDFKCIPPEEWMPYSPDMAPMDYAINGNLKINLKRRVARDRGRLVRAVRYEWSKLKIATIRRALRSWRVRVEMMVKRFGDHVEHVLN